jgi:hypothetical protein
MLLKRFILGKCHRLTIVNALNFGYEIKKNLSHHTLSATKNGVDTFAGG